MVSTVSQQTPAHTGPRRTISVERAGDVPELAPYDMLSWSRVIVERRDGMFVRHHGNEFRLPQMGADIETAARSLVIELASRAETADYQYAEVPAVAMQTPRAAVELVAAARRLRAELAAPGRHPVDMAGALPYLGEAAMDIAGMLNLISDTANAHSLAAVRDAADDAAHPIAKGANAVASVVEAVEVATGTLIDPVPDTLPTRGLLETLAAAHVEGLSLHTALLAAIHADRLGVAPAVAVDLACNEAWDDEVRAAGKVRAQLIEYARLAALAAEHDETAAAVV
ncbi:hypothetical protein Ssi03_51090 [Sphaerisporangium siamense]|uniref:Uncharacterized protein n=1 Tax=Sphaerisporangium siamense TaxID=795645 RepID=A0A7W7GA92_9ACTN|nr:hypothetical protein [Sphaerisporangium siamense]MBB4702187.1 hypothetical protein [Sphaerisporangium siamense]GII87119.1 hypothetical protein Ssi03_51090 [Sphaerisporangium siamense]